MLLFGLRLGASPRVCVTTTTRPTELIKRLFAEPSTALVRGSTYENRLHLAPQFFDKVVARYEGTRLGLQEIHAEILETSEGAWFATLDPARHVTVEAEYDQRYPVHLAIDAGSSTHTAAVWFQVHGLDAHRRRVSVFGDYHSAGRYSEANARAILAKSAELPSRGRLDTVRLDPAADAKSGIGPAVYGEYERVFGVRITARWPRHRVADGLDQLALLLETECLRIHPRCTHLKAAFQNYVRKQSFSGEWLDEPLDPQHPYEDLMDALRGGVRDRFPEGRAEQPRLRRIPVGYLF
jgi:hypothetical protein